MLRHRFQWQFSFRRFPKENLYIDYFDKCHKNDIGNKDTLPFPRQMYH